MITDILLRSVVNPPLVTKGSTLTYSEEDNNFIELYNYLSTLNNGSGVTPYNPATNYVGTYYVSYANNIWMHVSSSSTGVTPGTDGAIWELTTVGALAHQQGTDESLALGTSHSTTAQDVYDVVNSTAISLSQVAFNSLRLNGTLKKNAIYLINDIAASLSLQAEDLCYLFIHSFGIDKYSLSGTLMLRMPDVSGDLFAPVKWNALGTYATNSNVIYQGYVYRNITGSNNAVASPRIDITNWEQRLADTAYYTNRFYECNFIVDSSYVYITTIEDSLIDAVYSTNDLSNKYLDSFTVTYQCKADSNSTIGALNTIDGNVQRVNAANNSGIIIDLGGNINIDLVSLNNASIIFTGIYLQNFINLLNLTNVTLECQTDVAIDSLMVNFSASKYMTVTETDGTVLTGLVNDNGSSVTKQVTNTGGGVLDFDSLCGGFSDIFGVFECNGATASYSSIVRQFTFIPIKIKPISGVVITLTTSSINTAASNEIVGAVPVVVLDATKNDWAILTPTTNILGHLVWQITSYNVNI